MLKMLHTNIEMRPVKQKVKQIAPLDVFISIKNTISPNMVGYFSSRYSLPTPASDWLTLVVDVGHTEE